MKFKPFYLYGKPRADIKKILLKMKLIILLLTVALSQVNAASYAQKITLSENNAQLEKLFTQIRKQSGYNFLYNDQMLVQAKRVKVDVKEASLMDVLEICFAGQPLTYTITDKTIVVKRMPVSAMLQVAGKVTDAKGIPLAGVSIKLKDAPVGVVTDIDGKYSINVPDGTAVLIFSFIGMKSQEVAVSGRKTVDVVLEDDIGKLSEVLVIGYGSQSRQTLTTAISKLDTKVFENVPYSNAASALQGAVSGVRVQSRSGQPGIAPRIVVRGGTSINNPNGAQPLYIIDGVIRPDMNNINAEEIQSLQILKDAASTAIYGARGSNGVVLITTKSGKAGSAKITYGYDITTSRVAKTWDILPAREYIYFQRKGLVATSVKDPVQLTQLTAPTSAGTGNDLTNLTAFSPQYLTAANSYKLQQGWQSMPDPLDPSKTIIFSDTDFQDFLYRNGVSHNHTLTASGGTEKATFNAALGYLTAQGISIGSDYKRISLNFNGDFKVKDNVRAFARLILSKTGGETAQDPQNVLNPFNQAGSIAAPTLKYRFEDGTLSPGRAYNSGNYEYYLSRQDRRNDADGITVAAGAHWDILPGLAFDPQVSLYQETLDSRFFQRSYFEPPNMVNTRSANANFSKLVQKQLDAVFSYNNSFHGVHNLDGKLGFSYFDVFNTSLSASGQGAATDNIPTLNAAAQAISVSGSESKQKVIGFFGRVGYNYDQKYLFNFTARYDGASNLGEGNKWGFFPGVSVGWNLHKENFWKVMPESVSSFKLRGSYGVNGNISGLSPYQAQGEYRVATAYSGIAAIQNLVLPNSDLKWEQSKTLDGGVDIGLFNNRVSVIFEVYRRITSDLLTSLTLPPSSGFTSITTNLGTLQNNGIEIELGAQILPATSKLQWSASFNASKVDTKIIKLPYNGVANNRIGGVNVWDADAKAYVWKGGLQEGGRIGDMYDYLFTGVYGSDAEAATAPTDMSISFADKRKFGGDAKFADIDGNGIIDARDRVYLGNPYPTWTGGITNTLTYKGVSLTLRMDFTTGHTSFNNTRHRYFAQNSGQGGLIADIRNSWQNPGDQTDIPKYYWANTQQNFRPSSMFYEKGDFLAVRELTLSYSLPEKLVKKAKLAGVRFNLTGNNLYYFTGYKGLNPDDGGTDFGRYPIPRNFIFGANVSF